VALILYTELNQLSGSTVFVFFLNGLLWVNQEVEISSQASQSNTGEVHKWLSPTSSIKSEPPTQ